MLPYRFRHRVHLQREEQTQDPESGAIEVDWVTATIEGVSLDAVPAEVLTGPGREFLAASAPQAETTARINLRWFPVDRLEIYSWRVLWDGRVYNIESAETDVTARREWRLKCSDGVRDTNT